MTGKQFWYIIKAGARIVIRILAEVFHRLVLNIFDTLFGFLNWPGKTLRIKIFILNNGEQDTAIPPADLDNAIKYTQDVFQQNFNVKLLPAGKNESVAELLKITPPVEALY